MAKDGFVTSPEKDMRLRARVRRWLSSIGSAPAESPSSTGSRHLIWTALGSFVLFAVIVYAVIANVVPAGWLTFGQARLISVIAGALAAGIITYHVATAAYAMRRAFLSAASLTLLAAIGYGFTFSVKYNNVPTEITVATVPLQGASLLAALFILVLLLIGFVLERNFPRN
ncbi:hypothetical protein J2W42_000620 [Rhizobium tibeticum]|uniref:hypothetical protein n=1 Tax=Rhizobium tibeticum TaxID=501024 RepID=UPI002780D231|nr:hypothetical protein [Rhizobium tibeticum]MDP9807782.1 hypothetical protein [Rhizobium tibeticum]